MVSAVKICQQCLQTAAASGERLLLGLCPWTPLVTEVPQTPWAVGYSLPNENSLRHHRIQCEVRSSYVISSLSAHHHCPYLLRVTMSETTGKANTAKAQSGYFIDMWRLIEDCTRWKWLFVLL